MNEGANDPRLRWYPQSWRARYGDELFALLDDEYDGHLPTVVRLGLVAGGLRQRARHSGLRATRHPRPTESGPVRSWFSPPGFLRDRRCQLR